MLPNKLLILQNSSGRWEHFQVKFTLKLYFLITEKFGYHKDSVIVSHNNANITVTISIRSQFY